jgi:membrane-associated phospholipid phosphatase
MGPLHSTRPLARKARPWPILTLALALFAAAPAAAESPAAPTASASDPASAGREPAESQEAPAAVRRGDGRRTLHGLPANLGRTSIGVVSPANLPAFLAGGMAAAGASFLDADTREAATGQLGWSDTFETAGGPIYSTVFVAGMFTAGRLAHDPRFRAMTYDLLDAAIVNFAYTEVLKVAVGRERPNGQDNKSFPSGHTSNAFALASVVEGHYGWKIGVPAYVLAGLMGVSRIHEDKHWLSDVVAGAALGYVVGRTVTRVNGRPLERVASGGTTLHVSPIVARHARGLQLSVMF